MPQSARLRAGGGGSNGYLGNANELLYFLIGASLSLYAVIPQCSDILPNNSPSSTDEPLWWLCKKMGEISLQIPLKNTQNLS